MSLLPARLAESWHRLTGRTEMAEALSAERQMTDHLTESLTQLEQRMYEPGWLRLTALADQEFSRDGLRQITAVCRIMALKSPLIKRGLGLRVAYVWGQGVSITARAATKKRQKQDVNAVVQAFLDDDSNRRTFTSQQARETLERALGTDGNVFLACFTSPRTGRVQVRVVPWDEITDVVTNPEDASEPWYYRREWWEGPEGAQTRRVAHYPALGYRPKYRPRAHSDVLGAGGGAVEVMWDAPILHVAVGGQSGWKFGVPDTYAAIDWAQAYKEFLTDWARMIKALSRFAWRLTSKGSKQAQAKARISQAPSVDRNTGEPNAAGATALMPPDMALEAIPKSGATIDSDSGRPLAAMVAAALDVPVTMLLGDPGQTGARAVAETLDRPTELGMKSRRAVWTDAHLRLLNYVIDAAVRAPEGALKGVIKVDADGRETVELAGKTDRTIDITWPDLKQTDTELLVRAIVEADKTTYMPPLVVLRLLLEALGVADVDEILDSVTDDQGNFLRPDGAGGGAGQAAVDAFRNGQDPAALVGPGGQQADPQGQQQDPPPQQPPPED